MEETRLSPLHIGMVLPSLSGGGVERVRMTLARSLIEKGYRVDLVLLGLKGHYQFSVPVGLSMYYLRRRRTDRALLGYFREQGNHVQPIFSNPLGGIWARNTVRNNWPNIELQRSEIHDVLGVARYCRMVRPQILLSGLTRANNASVVARAMTGCRIPLVASVHNNVAKSHHYEGRGRLIAQTLMPSADAIVAVSRGISREIVKVLGIDPERVQTIYNAMPLTRIWSMAREEVSHPWFQPGEPPVVLTVLRDGPQKDWSTLVRAFAAIRRTVCMRLAILGRAGSAKYWARIMALAESLGVGEDVAYLGFDENPFRYMQRAALFVHSSHYEGLGNVLIEALACGTPVVSTDSPYGPAEILENGRWGRLTPVGDAAAMADAIVDSLEGDTVPAEALRRRAEDFSAERAVSAYAALFESLIALNADGGAAADAA